MPLRDLRNLPAPVVERLRDAGTWDGFGRSHRGAVIETGFDLRARPDGVEVRATDDADQPVLDGYAAVYGTSYDVAGGVERGGWSEIVTRGAVDKSVSESDDVYLLMDHDGLPIASTRAGTLVLSSDEVGLLSIARPDMASAWNTEIVSRVRSRELVSMSWGFTVVRQEWSEDYDERWITEARIWDTSVVKWPANPATHIHARAVEPVGMSLAVARALVERDRLSI